MLRKITILMATTLAVAVASIASAHSKPNLVPAEQGRPVDLVIALDVSGSMSGLIESAKQRLWDVVNELAQAQPQPDLRLAILTYGNPDYGVETGYVSVDMPFTRDLDAVMQTLFSFGTNGGDEYVSRAVTTSVTSLDWSSRPDAMKILFVAGNEAADQDPAVSVLQATQAAASKGIVVNTIYCGGDGDEDAPGWRNVAAMTNGLYANIDMNAAAVANIATPMDQELALLNQALNETYIAYGAQGGRYKANQVAQDSNAEAMSLPSMASRTVAKAGALYKNEDWDLVDAMEAGKPIAEMEEENLPAEMQAMDIEAREAYVKELAGRRDQMSADIEQLAKKRQAWIALERERLAETGDEGFDAVLIEGLRELARKKGFILEDSP
jgi:hypothetical protein